jgi:uncharacterized membrane protein YkvA (DUF1232 family)
MLAAMGGPRRLLLCIQPVLGPFAYCGEIVVHLPIIIGSAPGFLELPAVPLLLQADSYKPCAPRGLEKRIIRLMRVLRLWRLVSHDVHWIVAALRRPDRPWWLLPAVLAILIFTFDPLNFGLPPLGIFDDLIVLPLLLRAVVKLAQASRPVHVSIDL